MDKPKLLANQTPHYFSVTSIDFEKCYKVMDMRIAKGFTDRDLSFLLGYHPLYVRDVENPLHKKRYKARDTNFLLHIFECTLPDIMDGKLAELAYKLSVIVTVNTTGAKTYDIYKEQRNGKDKLYRSFTELLDYQGVGTKRTSATPAVLEAYVLNLLLEGYFDTPKIGLELFHKCAEHFGGHIRPSFIGKAIRLINRAGKVDEPKIKIEKNELRRWVYSRG